VAQAAVDAADLAVDAADLAVDAADLAVDAADLAVDAGVPAGRAADLAGASWNTPQPHHQGVRRTPVGARCGRTEVRRAQSNIHPFPSGKQCRKEASVWSASAAPARVKSA
jgi:hypothetical protein